MRPSFLLFKIFVVFLAINAKIANGGVKFKICVVRDGKEVCVLNPPQRDPTNTQRSYKQQDSDFVVNPFAGHSSKSGNFLYSPEDLGPLGARFVKDNHASESSELVSAIDLSNSRPNPVHPPANALFYPANVFVYNSSYPGLMPRNVAHEESSGLNPAHSEESGSNANNPLTADVSESPSGLLSVLPANTPKTKTPDFLVHRILCVGNVSCKSNPLCCSGHMKPNNLRISESGTELNNNASNPGFDPDNFSNIDPPDCTGSDPCYESRCWHLGVCSHTKTNNNALNPGFDPNHFPNVDPPDCTGPDSCSDPRCRHLGHCKGTRTNNTVVVNSRFDPNNSLPEVSNPQYFARFRPVTDPKQGQGGLKPDNDPIVYVGFDPINFLPEIPPPDCSGAADPCIDPRCCHGGIWPNKVSNANPIFKSDKVSNHHYFARFRPAPTLPDSKLPFATPDQGDIKPNGPKIDFGFDPNNFLPEVPPPDCSGIDPCFDPRCCREGFKPNNVPIVDFGFESNNFPPEVPPPDCTGFDPCFDPRCCREGFKPNNVPIVDVGFDPNNFPPEVPPPDCSGIDPCFDRRCCRGGSKPVTRVDTHFDLSNFFAGFKKANSSGIFIHPANAVVAVILNTDKIKK